MKMTPEHHRAVAEIFGRSEMIDRMESMLRRFIREGFGWAPIKPSEAAWLQCVFCNKPKTVEGRINWIALCAPCLREYAGARWAVIAMLRMPAVGEQY
jgi:hypothetical protein